MSMALGFDMKIRELKRQVPFETVIDVSP